MFVHRLDDRRWLRPVEEADAEELYERSAGSREMLAAWMPWASDATVQRPVHPRQPEAAR